jgi:poly-gamma-glutamate capsule biosynthesis protein CapA/YwtB (metallophosphatase superfamily)
MKNKHLSLLFLLFVFTLSCSTQARTNNGTVADSTKHITLLFVGDLMQHTGQIDAAAVGDTYNYNDCFKYVKNNIQSADVAIANFEVTLGGKPYHGYPSFSAPDEYLRAIKDAGFDVLLTANNHCLDTGKRGLERTIVMMDSLKIPHLGTYRNEEERSAHYPFLLQKNGFRIVLLNYTFGTNGNKVRQPNVVNYIDRNQIEADIVAAQMMHPDAIIACLHWGIEYKQQPEKTVRDLVQWLLAHGVTHVIGGHPHVIQPIEINRDAQGLQHVVVYSLGNYISNMSVPNTTGGMEVKLELEKDSVTRLKDFTYSLVYTSRPSVSGHKNYELIPTANPPQWLNAKDRNMMKSFVNSTHQLFKVYNKGVK